MELPDVEGETGFVTQVAETGEQALEMIERQTPDILLLDHKLPGISGLDVLDHITQREDKMVTVMVTAYASLDTAVTAIKRGAYDFLAKPFTPEELRAVVTKAGGSLILARHARQLAEDKKRIRFQFISVLAHELKSPLSAIEGYLQLLRDPSVRDDDATCSHVVERCVVRSVGMRKMIRDLLDLTALESGQKVREVQDLDLETIARAAVENVAAEAAERGIDIEIDIATLVPLRGDPWEIQTLLNNLVSNAVKYNRDGGRVALHVSRDDGKVTVQVADTGIGMTAEETARLFSDFARIKNEKTRDILGSGLGLSTVRKVCALYGGDVTVESEPGVGSTFTAVLNVPPV